MRRPLILVWLLWLLLVATRSDVEAYQSVIDGLSAVAFAQVKALLQDVDNPNPIAFRDSVLAIYPELLQPYASAASEVAAEWYTTLRGNAGVTRPFSPILAPDIPTDQLDAGVRYSLTPLFRPQEFIGADVLSLLAGFTQKMIANQGRDTVTRSAVADPVRVGYARIPRTGCCAFCGLMASRGAVYRSEASAGGVVGRGVDPESTAGKRGGQGKGVRLRGAQAAGKKFHDHCRCVVAPQFVGGDNEYMKYTANTFTELYQQSVETVKNKDGFAVTDLKSTLATWRAENGSK